MATFQEIILKLQEFWASHGCLIAQPYYTQVGAGTMNPATFLRVLGPEPWNVAYVEPSVRPDDGRYGENPNRFQVHYQYQVILKPDPGNPQELYLDSLKALGIDPRQHDIRFVEDNWEQPAISAWGLGWEVWLDGQEITQFTYFQQMGGVTLEPVSVEITYGLERILIALNNAEAIWNEEWGAGIPYGEIRRREEFEHSKYYFEIADIERARHMYDLFSAEAEACLEQGLVLPAYDYVLKCSHTFNILDARGAISVAERQAFFRRMRELARRVAENYLEQRKQQEYPLLRHATRPAGVASPAAELPPPPTQPLPFLLEIGVEELPAQDVDAAHEQLRARIPSLLEEWGLPHGAIRIFTTPRRLTVSIDSLAPRQIDREEWVKGPPADKAFDSSGHPTPAAQGFARKNNLRVDDLIVREEAGRKYVFGVIRRVGRPTPEVLAEALPGLVASLSFEKSMRWNESGAWFSRPIRWFVALLGDQVIPFTWAGVTADRVSRGLRPYDSPSLPIPSADQYVDLMHQAGVVLDKEERKAMIAEQASQAATLVGGQAILEDELLNEVANLIEKPTAVMGGFDERFLALPQEVLISVMKTHQRYFPVADAKDAGRLLPYFIAIRNGDDLHLDKVRQGNEHVLRARFTDAEYFVREDLKLPLEAYRPKLATLTFHTRLGSMLEKSERMLRLARTVADQLGFDVQQRAQLQRAAFLAKADLVTQMVTEMTSLQGIMGREYALRSGEDPQVAMAIGEQYQPVPRTPLGLALALTDRLDSLVGLFAAGVTPSGAKDPFGLRRAALGVVQPLVEHNLDFDLAAVVAETAALQPVPVSADIQAQVLDFLAGRLAVVLKEAGYRYDVVEAVLAAQANNPAGAARSVKALQAWVSRPDWERILPAFARCVRILRSASVSPEALPPVDPNRFIQPEERALYEALRSLAPQPPSTLDDLLHLIQNLTPTINAFFDQVLVIAEDENLRTNRLALVGQIATLARGLADLSYLEGF